jgi:hypothetical protein
MEKVLNEHLADLRLDLKDSGSDWSDAELERCLEKSVADLSRFIPREKSLEVTFDFTVENESFTTPAVEDVDYFVDDYDLNSKADGQACTMAAYTPDVPRPVKVTVTDADSSITALTIIVAGYDTDGKYQEEFFHLFGGLVQTGNKYFSMVTSVELEEIAGNGASDALDVGTGDANGIYVQLDNKSIRQGSEKISSMTLDTDYIMDYHKGRIAMKSGGDMVVSTAYTITEYTKSQLDIDLSEIASDLIRVDSVEYPTGNVPRITEQIEIWGNTLTLRGGVNTQAEATDEEHAVIRYLAPHAPPTVQSSGSYPSFLNWTVQLAAAAYALFMKALQYEHQAITDIAYVDTALDKVAAYLETNDTTDNAKDVLANITDDVADLRTAIQTALDAANTHLDEVKTISIDKATTGAEAYLDTGDGTIPTLNTAGRVSEKYSDYTRARVQVANARVQTAIAYIQEAAARLQNLESHVSEASGWMRIAEDFIQEANSRIQNTQNYLAIAEVFRNEAIDRRNEAWAIWTSPNQVAPQYQLTSSRQVAR